MKSNPASFYLKFLLVFLALTISVGTLYYTKGIVVKLEKRDRQVVDLYASTLEYIANSETVNNDFTFIFDNIIQRIDFPMILTDADNNIHFSESGGGVRNIDYDTTMTGNELKGFLTDKVTELSLLHDPILITYSDSIVFGKIYYGDSDLITELKYYPYFQILVAVFFILTAYLSFSYIKRNEQSNIYVGMAKEAAHQLGTPISSLMGWVELLKLHYTNPDKVTDISDEIDSDLTRLNKVANRFSKIGSKPELKDENVYKVVSRVINYFERRLPNFGKNVSISISGEENINLKLNAELFEWVIENLIKNALDAIESEHGEISFKIISTGNNTRIEVADSGKGIDIKKRKDIFRPGYSTKKRGWGLGLSLSKRIIEDYHKGKIFVKNSVINKGTTFYIVLPK